MGVAVGKGSKRGMANGLHPGGEGRAEVCQDEQGLLTFMFLIKCPELLWATLYLNGFLLIFYISPKFDRTVF